MPRKNKSGSRTALIVAMIALLVALGAVLFTNWDRIFTRHSAAGSTRAVPADTGAGSAPSLPDLTLAAWALDPGEPVPGQRVRTRVAVRNKGAGDSGPFLVEWWAQVDSTGSPHIWQVPGLAAGQNSELEWIFDGYPHPSEGILMRVVIDPGNEVVEQDESNNVRERKIQVKRP